MRTAAASNLGSPVATAISAYACCTSLEVRQVTDWVVVGSSAQVNTMRSGMGLGAYISAGLTATGLVCPSCAEVVRASLAITKAADNSEATISERRVFNIYSATLKKLQSMKAMKLHGMDTLLPPTRRSQAGRLVPAPQIKQVLTYMSFHGQAIFAAWQPSLYACSLLFASTGPTAF